MKERIRSCYPREKFDESKALARDMCMCTFLREDRARADFYRRRKSFLTPSNAYLHAFTRLYTRSAFQRGFQRLWNCNSKLTKFSVNFSISRVNMRVSCLNTSLNSRL